MRTYMAKPGEVARQWLLVDGTGKKLGRLASEIATVLMGKHKPTYTPHVDTGDFVVVVNASAVHVSPPGKIRGRLITRHTGFLGGLKQESLSDAFARNPSKVIELAVRRMLPKSDLGRHMFSKLKVYKGAEHPHAAQQPQAFPANV